MKSYFLIFVFVPVIMVYSAAGDLSSAPVFGSLLLIAFAVDLLGDLAKFYADQSEEAIIDAYKQDAIRAWADGNLRKAGEKLRALELFETRGVA